jgi:hypothetical protein
MVLLCPILRSQCPRKEYDAQLLMNILLLRHAEATGNPEMRMQGQGSFPLTPNGVLQAQHLARQVLNSGGWPTAIYSSPIERAKQTTEILVQVLQEAHLDIPVPPVHYRDELREFHHGIFEGLTWTEAQHTGFLDSDSRSRIASVWTRSRRPFFSRDLRHPSEYRNSLDHQPSMDFAAFNCGYLRVRSHMATPFRFG